MDLLARQTEDGVTVTCQQPVTCQWPRCDCGVLAQRTYDQWKTTNPDDEFLGEEPTPDENLPPEPEPCPRCNYEQGHRGFKRGKEVWVHCPVCNGIGTIERGKDE